MVSESDNDDSDNDDANDARKRTLSEEMEEDPPQLHKVAKAIMEERGTTLSDLPE